MGPGVKSIVFPILGASSVCFGFWIVGLGGAYKPRTLKADWKTAEKEYSKFQNLNPLSGLSSK